MLKSTSDAISKQMIVSDQSDDKTRVLYVDHCAQMSGGEIALLNLLKAIDRSRYDPLVVLCSDGPLVEQLRSADVETHVLLLDPAIANTRKDSLGVSSLTKLGSAWRALHYIRQLKEFIQFHRVDIIHTNSLKADILGGFAARLARRPLIWHVRDRIADDYLPPLVARSFRFLCHLLPQVVIANSSSTLTSLRLREDDRSAVVYSGTQNRVDRNVVHDGLDPAGFSAVTSSTRNLSARPRIGLLGRISPWKGQHVFLRAAAIVLKEFPQARFQIIGKAMFDEAEYEASLHRLVDELQIAHAVEFVGFRSDVANVLRELSVLVHASTVGEPFGQVIVEGMAAGLPVVATNGGGVPEIVQDGQTGLLVPMNDVEAMADAVTRLLANPEMAREMGRKAQARARDAFSIERTARSVEAIYKRLQAERA